jgi:hypothetical protein
MLAIARLALVIYLPIIDKPNDYMSLAARLSVQRFSARANWQILQTVRLPQTLSDMSASPSYTAHRSRPEVRPALVRPVCAAMVARPRLWWRGHGFGLFWQSFIRQRPPDFHQIFHHLNDRTTIVCYISCQQQLLSVHHPVSIHWALHK